ncbi:hypothetical protein SPAN111604_14875 [Sphingomonas antarctica]|uniref:PEPxxWA-CTERM sorting domain-containing protein n=1 Tax=Sphingomonas antarctica TaxID=2040274 RepID=UPI0039EC2AE7
MSKIILAAVLLALPLPALAVTPLSYDTTNGNTGTYTYHDDSYSGAGSTTTDGSALTGGLGDLTDGVLPSGHWNSVPNVSNLPWVGWYGYNPTVAFNFSPGTVINHAIFYFDDNTDGGVALPQGVTFLADGNALTGTLTKTGNGIFSAYDYDFGGVALTSLSATLNRDGNWVMLGEAQFTGPSGAVPEPASWAMMVGGFGLLGGALRRRSAKSVSFA